MIKITVYLVLAVLAFGLFSPALAAENTSLVPTGFETICRNEGGGLALAKCIQQIYIFSLGFGSLLALLMIVLSGYRYMTAAGNAQQLQNAKDAFAAAFIGLIILFISFILLYTINPDLVRFKGLAGLPILEYKPLTMACKDLTNLSPILVKPGAGNQVSNALKSKLSNVWQQNQKWWITEAYPPAPTVVHQDPSHYNGAAVDLAFVNSSDATRVNIQTLGQILNQEGFVLVRNEYDNPSPGSTAGHFHVRGSCPI